MKTALIGVAGLLLAMLTPFALARAQGLPPGSYLQTCREVHMEGDRLVAACRRMDGRWTRTALPDPYRCRGGISNSNGILRCEYAGGPGPGPAYGGEFRERCERWHHEAGELRYRLDREGNPYERGRMEGRLHELRERLERCRY